ncbi:NAD(P)(+)--arginine ADP-ribosyltransferase 1-like [Mugil cephalus]|uniref:NAD(P)(+)--arginine ADP-ribosyltransferase 1-like n=1 Tax=Mugil cephalus TaxID=48193 RepID=UPI001FB5731E|nr:NAD(P)(+)--arginine ADP-ribosyltransferase 1-like [Mugil cephalus]
MDNKLWIACFWKMAMAALLAAAPMGKNDAKAPIKLDMAPNSVDDMYAGCESKMEALVNSTYLVNELKNDKVFEKAWKNASKKHNTELSEYQRRAVYVYTDKNTNIYSVFNEKVRTQRSGYKTEAFKYHSLHFFLTRALQTLKLKNKKCLTGYRRTNLSFTYNPKNPMFRFGSFTSSSHTTYANDTFGTKTCFEIYTCFGAEISSYSAFESEREILIPPYEIFKVRKRTEPKKSLPCEVVYTVESTGKTQSNLNCALVKKK